MYAKAASSSDFFYPDLWLSEQFGKTLNDLPNLQAIDGYGALVSEASAEEADVIVIPADLRIDYAEAWQLSTDDIDSTGKMGFGHNDSIFNEIQVLGVTAPIGGDVMVLRADEEPFGDADFQSALLGACLLYTSTSVFNADSRKKQEQNFMAASKLAQQAKKRFVPIVGYGYGKKKTSSRGLPKFYMELAGKDFWTELTGDEEFYIKLIRFMDKLPEKYVEEFDASYQKASNRLVREFTQEFCFEDGSIDWEKLVEFNSGN